VLKGEDIVLLLKLSDSPPEWTVRTLADETSIPRSVVHRALKRLAVAGLFDERRRRVNASQAEEFLVHGLRYVFPAVLEGESRGIPTAWAAEPLAGLIASPPGDLPPVWPDARADGRGLALRPLHAAVPEAARRDPHLRESLALVDALRLGDARTRGVAAELLSKRLGGDAA
jgi:DNA-binding transcriptional MocR family regulator